MATAITDDSGRFDTHAGFTLAARAFATRFRKRAIYCPGGSKHYGCAEALAMGGQLKRTLEPAVYVWANPGTAQHVIDNSRPSDAQIEILRYPWPAGTVTSSAGCV